MSVVLPCLLPVGLSHYYRSLSALSRFISLYGDGQAASDLMNILLGDMLAFSFKLHNRNPD